MNHAQTIRRYAITLAAVVFSAFLQAFTLQVFFTPMQILSSGFTGVAVSVSYTHLRGAQPDASKQRSAAAGRI